jgi:hypothetical protein
VIISPAILVRVIHKIVHLAIQIKFYKAINVKHYVTKDIIKIKIIIVNNVHMNVKIVFIAHQIAPLVIYQEFSNISNKNPI